MQTARTLCEYCHYKEAQYQASTIMREYVACIDCHMPHITKSAVGNAEKFTGDIRTHMMAIDPVQIDPFTNDSKLVLSQISL
jgi:formate-dependent nitrite reductase cytochrome c552 subunit